MLYALILWAIVFTAEASLPKTWKACKRSDPNYEECLKNAVQIAFNDLANGKPSLGVLPTDPLHFESLIMDQKTSPSSSFRLEFRDLYMKGFGHVDVEKVKTDWKTMEIVTKAPTAVTFDGKYKVDGKLLIMALKGEGDVQFIYEHVVTKMNMTLSTFEKDGDKYYHVDKVVLRIIPDRLRTKFENLFGGDKKLGETINTFLNDNWKDVLEQVSPAITDSFGEAFRQIANRVFSKIKADEISPP